VGVARAPDVVRDLLRPPEVEDRDEPGADRPPRREPKLGRPEREQVLVGAVEPADEEEGGDDEERELTDADRGLAGVARVDLRIRDELAGLDPREEAKLGDVRDDRDDVDDRDGDEDPDDPLRALAKRLERRRRRGRRDLRSLRRPRARPEGR
jgi:hypothetical protein